MTDAMPAPETVAVEVAWPETVVVEVGVPGPPGRDATPISADANNRLTVGGDGGLYVPDDLLPDPLAYYILAKS